MKNSFKKTIVPIFLIIFLFGFLIPSNKIFALDPELIISVDKTELGSGELATATATLNNVSSAGEQDILFLLEHGIFTNSSCKITTNTSPTIKSCFVKFTFDAVNAASANLSASTTINGQEYKSNLIIIKKSASSYSAGGSQESIVCTPPQIKSANGIACITPTDTTYEMLAPLPGLEGTINTVDDCPFGKYLNIIIKLIMGISAVMAMVMITMGGIQYITSDLVSSKEAGKETITHAILGLVMLLGSFLILNTINPKLLNSCLKIPTVSIEISPEQELIIKNWTGLGNCEVVTNVNSPCHPSKLTAFSGTSSATPPFDTKAAQASAICQLESAGVASTPIGKSPNQILDKCSDNKPFSFGLFQINAAAHRDDIPACKDAFEIPTGHGQSQGDCLEKDKKSGYCAKWSCKTKEPAYTECQNYLINPVNNIQYAATSNKLNRWSSWTTYNSCRNKF